jgi:ferric hydroxamate transport system substrate-binding protein
MKTRRLAAALLAALLPLTVTACGTTDTTADAAEAPAANDSGDCADDTTSTSTGPVSLTDAWGRHLELDRPAERVAVLEWQQTEDVLTLCLTPVAVADVDGYTVWDTAEELPSGVSDVGTRGEPNIDALLATGPDLVIVEAYSSDDAIIKQLEKYDVPVLATKGADTDDPIQNMLDTFTLIAEATGREDRAASVVDDFEQHLDMAKQDVAGSGASGTAFVYFDGWIQGGNVSIRPFGQGSLIGELGEALGMTNAWTGKVDKAYGLGVTDIEGMTKVGDAAFFHTSTVDKDGDVMAELAKNDIWASLPAVEDGRVYGFPDGVWTFGGPRSAEQALDAYVSALTS